MSLKRISLYKCDSERFAQRCTISVIYLTPVPFNLHHFSYWCTYNEFLAAK